MPKEIGNVKINLSGEEVETIIRLYLKEAGGLEILGDINFKTTKVFHPITQQYKHIFAGIDAEANPISNDE